MDATEEEGNADCFDFCIQQVHLQVKHWKWDQLCEEEG